MKFRLTGCINIEHEVRSPRASQEKRKNIGTLKMKAEATIPSIRKMSADLSSSIGTVHTYLRRELKLFPYKVTIGQSVFENHKTNCYAFCKRIMSEISKEHRWSRMTTITCTKSSLSTNKTSWILVKQFHNFQFCYNVKLFIIKWQTLLITTISRCKIFYFKLRRYTFLKSYHPYWETLYLKLWTFKFYFLYFTTALNHY